MEKIRAMLEDLTLDDLRRWAGDRIYSRARSYVPSVTQLSLTDDNAIVAWVSGGDKYAAFVRKDETAMFESGCTCPYDEPGPCKHVVAVILAVSERINAGMEIPLIDDADELCIRAFSTLSEEPWDEEEDYFDDVDDPDEFERGDPRKIDGSRAPEITEILNGKSQSELVMLLADLALEYPEIDRRIRDSYTIETGHIAGVVQSLRNEIRRVTAEEAWYNPWKHIGNLPDYSHIEGQLRLLLEHGHADLVLDLGMELWEAGNRQIEQSNDEGATSGAIATCMNYVLMAIPKSSLPRPDQLIWIVDHLLADENDLLTGTEAILADSRYSRKDWRAVARTLETRLGCTDAPTPDRFHERYGRESVIHQLRQAYERGGEGRKVIPMLEKEAGPCRMYATLVDALIEADQRDRARQWCIQGFTDTIGNAPGIASRLRDRLRYLAEEDGRLDLAAAYMAEVFFDVHSEEAYINLRGAAEKIGNWERVREAILDYLDTGRRPGPAHEGEAGWPLPVPEVVTPQTDGLRWHHRFPQRELLIRIAILENRNDDAVALFNKNTTSTPFYSDLGERLADAVTDSHPDVALGIWKSHANQLIGLVKSKAYEEAAIYLRRMRDLYNKLSREEEWVALLAALRVKHKPKRRLMEVLDGIEANRKLID